MSTRVRFRHALLTAFAAVLLSTMASAQQTLIDSHPDDSLFGYSIDVSGDRAIIGSVHSGQLGRALIFSRDASGNWIESAVLTPNDGGTATNFGFSVGIDGDIAVVGRVTAGAVYIFEFDGTTWNPAPPIYRGSNGGKFGQAVAIDGTTIVVGAPLDNSSGRAYVFERDENGDWVEATTPLEPINITFNEAFGSAVDIGDEHVVIGAPTDGIGGLVYIFDRATWAYQQFVGPGDPSFGDEFGGPYVNGSGAIDINGDLLAVGSRREDLLGTDSGAVYLFRRGSSGTWSQIAKLKADNAEANDHFGFDVAIDPPGTQVVVGSVNGDTTAADDSGAVYVFADDGAGTWEQVNTFSAHAPQTGQAFGWALAITEFESMLASAIRNNPGNFLYYGTVDVLELQPQCGAGRLADSDGDGLLDDWECNGIPYMDSSGNEQRYMLPDADPQHKNLYVELDAMTGLALEPQAIDDVVDAFANAPVSNPDGTTGIILTVDTSENTLPFQVWSLCVFTDAANTRRVAPCEYFQTRQQHFGTPAERAAPDAEGYLAARRQAYRYGIVVYGDGCTDAAGETWKTGLSDFWIYAAEFTGKSDRLCLNANDPANCRRVMQASLFMHELGHTLGLKHGGGDNVNYKPNFVSVMNYMLIYPFRFTTSWRMDYSREEISTLNENMLNETTGVASVLYTGSSAVYGCSGASKRIMRLNGSAVDFNCDGDMDDEAANGDLNYWEFCIGSCPGGCDDNQCPTPGQLLNGHDDWSNIVYEVVVPATPENVCFCSGCDCGASCPSSRGPADVVRTCGVTWTEVDHIWDTTDDPCPGDLDGDLTVNIFDLLILLDAWGSFEGDISGDLNTDIFDLFELLANWGSCE